MHIFHKWGKWEVVKREFFDPRIADFCTETKRRRICTDCLKRKYRSLT